MKRVPGYFFKWKMQCFGVDKQFYTTFLVKSTAIRQVLTKKLNYIKMKVVESLKFWLLQVRHKVPIYNESREKGKLKIKVMLERLNKKAKHSADKRARSKRFTVLEIAGKLEECFTELLEPKFAALKRHFITRLRSLYELEAFILQSKQPLLVRTLRLNAGAYFDHFQAVKKVDLKPTSFLKIVTDKNLHHDQKFDYSQQRLTGFSYFKRYMVGKRELTNRVTSDSLLLQGVWKSNEPYLRFREYFLMKIFQNNYINNLLSGYHLLKGFTERMRKKERLEQRIAKVNNHFKRVWGRLYIKTLMRDKITYFSTVVLFALEVNKRLQNLQADLKKSGHNSNQPVLSRQLRNNNATVVSIKERFTQRYAEVKNYFPNDFLNILLDTTIPKNRLKERLSLCLFDVLYYLFAQGIEEIAFNYL